MSSPFDKTYTEIFNEYLTAWKNHGDPDVSVGSYNYIKSAVLAGVDWGLYRFIRWVSKQIFPDTADENNLIHHGWVHDLPRNQGESLSDYLARLMNHIQEKPAGGNANDYKTWAKSITNISEAWVFPLGQGLGTVDILIVCTEITGTADATEANKLHDADGGFISNTVGATVRNTTQGTETTISAFVDSGELTLTDDIFVSGDVYALEEIPNQDLIDEVQTYIDGVRPVTAKASAVQAPTILSQNVTMAVTGATADEITTIQSEIEAFLNTRAPSETLYVAQLTAIAIQQGAENATVTVPAGDVTPSTYEMIRPGTLNVS